MKKFNQGFFIGIVLSIAVCGVLIFAAQHIELPAAFAAQEPIGGTWTATQQDAALYTISQRAVSLHKADRTAKSGFVRQYNESALLITDWAPLGPSLSGDRLTRFQEYAAEIIPLRDGSLANCAAIGLIDDWAPLAEVLSPEKLALLQAYASDSAALRDTFLTTYAAL